MTFDPIEEEEAQGRWKRKRDEEPAPRGWKIFLAVLLVLVLAGAATVVFAGRPIAFAIVKRQTTRKFPDVRWVAPAELAGWRADGSRAQPVILDARTETEYAVSHLPDASRIDPYRPLLRPLKGLEQSVPIVVYGTVGYRGARVAYWLAGHGYSNVQNLEGGIFLWANQDRPVVRQGAPTLEVHPYQSRWGLMLESRHRIEAPPIEKRSAAP